MIRSAVVALSLLLASGVVTPQKSEAGIGIIISGAMMTGSPNADTVVAVGVTMIALTVTAAAFAHDYGIWVPGLSPAIAGGIILLDETDSNVSVLESALAQQLPEIGNPAILRKLAALTVKRMARSAVGADRFVVRFSRTEVEGLLATAGITDAATVDSIAARLQ